MYLFIVVLLQVSWVFAVPLPASLPKPLKGGPIDLGRYNDAELSYSIITASDKALFHLKVTNTTLLRDQNERAWVSFGFAEPASGGIMGSDVVSVEFAVGSTTECTVVDRYIPFAAYPLDYGSPSAPHFQAPEDKCQENSWTVDQCVRNVDVGSMNIYISRPLSAFDDQDRAVESGTLHVVWAYGKGSDVLTSGVRRSDHVTLFTKDMTIPDKPKDTRLPEDAWGNQTLRTSNYVVPPDNASYACTAVSAIVPYGFSTSLIAFDRFVKPSNGSHTMQSMVLYACPPFQLFPYMNETMQCGKGYIQRPATFCSEVLYRWANGIESFVLPPDVGFKLNERNRFLVLETRYENPQEVKGLVDNSGVIYHYSRHLRKYAAGSLVLGDPLDSLSGKSVADDYADKVSTTCPSLCTKLFRDTVHIFASSPHMNSFGRSIETLKHSSYAAGGEYNETVCRTKFWSKGRQWTHTFEKPVQMKRGDQLSTTCTYDTRKKPRTRFGSSVDEEMCRVYLFYYPRQDLSNAVGLPVLSGDLNHCGISSSGPINGTLCGKKVLSTDMSNLPLNRSGAAADRFGMPPNVCYQGNAPPMPEQRAANSSENACFPADAVVHRRDGRLVAMRDLQLGDEVASGSGEYSAVFAFTHRLRTGLFQFVRIHAGSRTLYVSPGHYVYVNGKLTLAADVAVGDLLHDESNSILRVTDVRVVHKEGLFNPQTKRGSIMVNGFKASCYTSTIAPTGAHATLSFLRTMSAKLGIHMLSLEHGLRSIPFLNLLS